MPTYNGYRCHGESKEKKQATRVAYTYLIDQSVTCCLLVRRRRLLALESEADEAGRHLPDERAGGVCGELYQEGGWGARVGLQRQVDAPTAAPEDGAGDGARARTARIADLSRHSASPPPRLVALHLHGDVALSGPEPRAM
jgi:hypothetical protein